MRRGDAECDIALPDDWHVRPEEEFLQALGETFTRESVEVIYR
jgi:hypothetical protein